MSKKETIFPETELGGRIQQIRLSAGLDRKQFYDCVLPDESEIKDDSKEKNVFNWESGKNKPSLEFIQSICKTFDCSADYLLGIIPERNYDHIKMMNKTGLSETTIKLLERWNVAAFPQVARIIDFIIQYRMHCIESNISNDDLIDRLNRFFTNQSKELQYSHRTGRLIPDENGIEWITPENLFYDTISTDDAAIVGINSVLMDMKKEWNKTQKVSKK